MADDDTKFSGTISNLPIGELFRSVALGIAEAQTKLDESSMAVAELMSGVRVGENGETMDSRVYFGSHFDPNTQKMVPDRLSMIELGFTPTFYQFVDTVIEIKVAMSVAKSEHLDAQSDRFASQESLWSQTPRPRATITTTPVDATYSSSYDFNAEFSSVIKTKLVPIPPPAMLEDRIQRVLSEGQQRDSRPADPIVPPIPIPPVDVPDPVAPDPPQAVHQTNELVIKVGSRSTTMGVTIKRSSDNQVITPNTAPLTITSAGGSAKMTAARLAVKLNEKMSRYLGATSRRNRVKIEFKIDGEFQLDSYVKPAPHAKKPSTVNVIEIK